MCLFVNTITSERLNLGWWHSVGRWCIVKEYRPSSNFRLICALGPQPPIYHTSMISQKVNKPMAQILFH